MTEVTWHLDGVGVLGPGGHGHVEVAEAVLLLAEPLEGSEEELRPHPQPPRRADVGHDLHLAQPPVLAVLLAPARLQANKNWSHQINSTSPTLVSSKFMNLFLNSWCALQARTV